MITENLYFKLTTNDYSLSTNLIGESGNWRIGKLSKLSK